MNSMQSIIAQWERYVNPIGALKILQEDLSFLQGEMDSFEDFVKESQESVPVFKIRTSLLNINRSLWLGAILSFAFSEAVETPVLVFPTLIGSDYQPGVRLTCIGPGGVAQNEHSIPATTYQEINRAFFTGEFQSQAEFMETMEAIVDVILIHIPNSIL